MPLDGFRLRSCNDGRQRCCVSLLDGLQAPEVLKQSPSRALAYAGNF